MKQNKLSSNQWTVVSLLMTVIGIAGYFLLISLGDQYDARQSLDNYRTWSPLVMLAQIGSIVFLVIVASKARSWHKIIPIIFIFVVLVFIVLTLFAYLLSA